MDFMGDDRVNLWWVLQQNELLDSCALGRLWLPEQQVFYSYDVSSNYIQLLGKIS